MKKKNFKALISTALMLCMALSLLTAAAYADASISCTVGQQLDNVSVYDGSSTITSGSYLGDIAPGLNPIFNGSSVYLNGIPTTAGTYEAQLNLVTEAGDVSVNVTMVVAAAPQAPAQTSAPVAFDSKPVITKHPTGETVEAGGAAVFVSRADGVDSFVWRIVSPDTSNTYKASEAPWYFKGLSVSGADTERLELSNIPASMNGWAVECMYKNSNGYSFSNGAIITVSGATDKTNDPSTNNTTTNKPAANSDIKAPTVTQLTKSADGKSLSVTASNNSPGLALLSYQWYSSDTKDGTMTAISGANQSSYTPPASDSTKYYRVEVVAKSNDGSKSSTTVQSNIIEFAATSGSAGGQNTAGGNNSQGGDNSGLPVPSESASPSPAPTPIPTPENGGDSYDRDSSSTLIFYIVVAGLALLAVGGILVYLIIVNAKGKGSEDDE